VIFLIGVRQQRPRLLLAKSGRARDTFAHNKVLPDPLAAIAQGVHKASLSLLHYVQSAPPNSFTFFESSKQISPLLPAGFQAHNYHIEAERLTNLNNH